MIDRLLQMPLALLLFVIERYPAAAMAKQLQLHVSADFSQCVLGVDAGCHSMG